MRDTHPDFAAQLLDQVIECPDARIGGSTRYSISPSYPCLLYCLNLCYLHWPLVLLALDEISICLPLIVCISFNVQQLLGAPLRRPLEYIHFLDQLHAVTTFGYGCDFFSCVLSLSSHFSLFHSLVSFLCFSLLSFVLSLATLRPFLTSMVLLMIDASLFLPSLSFTLLSAPFLPPWCF